MNAGFEKNVQTTRCGKVQELGRKDGGGVVVDVVDLRADTLSTSQSSGDGTARALRAHS